MNAGDKSKQGGQQKQTGGGGAKIASRTKAVAARIVGTCRECDGGVIFARVSEGSKRKGTMMRVCEKNPDHRFPK